jgi:GntR family histidine utilization transcriptional repressor
MKTLTLHERIRSELESQILSGTLAPGDRIPVEHELMEEYSCSRMTVSKAISSLVAAGLIERRKKAGSFVSRPRMHSMMLVLPDVQTDAIEKGQAYAFQVLKRQIRPARRQNATEIELAQGGELLVVLGLHIVNQRPLATEERIISLASVPEIEEVSFSELSPGTWLLQYIPWTESKTQLRATGASRKEAPLLDIYEGSACLEIERRTWRDSTPITYVRQLFNGAIYDLTAHFGGT